MTMSGRSVRDHDWRVWIYEAGVILMVIRLTFSVTSSGAPCAREALASGAP